jgi:hypothetical protein
MSDIEELRWSYDGTEAVGEALTVTEGVALGEVLGSLGEQPARSVIATPAMIEAKRMLVVVIGASPVLCFLPLL